MNSKKKKNMLNRQRRQKRRGKIKKIKTHKSSHVHISLMVAGCFCLFDYFASVWQQSVTPQTASRHSLCSKIKNSSSWTKSVWFIFPFFCVFNFFFKDFIIIEMFFRLIFLFFSFTIINYSMYSPHVCTYVRLPDYSNVYVWLYSAYTISDWDQTVSTIPSE